MVIQKNTCFGEGRFIQGRFSEEMLFSSLVRKSACVYFVKATTEQDLTNFLVGAARGSYRSLIVT